jgi:hypothetical protein
VGTDAGERRRSPEPMQPGSPAAKAWTAAAHADVRLLNAARAAIDRRLELAAIERTGQRLNGLGEHRAEFIRRAHPACMLDAILMMIIDHSARHPWTPAGLYAYLETLSEEHHDNLASWTSSVTWP